MSSRLSQLLFSALIMWACPSNSEQTESFNQMPSDLTFDEDFLDFNDDEFDEKLSSWQDNFVIRVSHQVFGQINNHQVEPIPDLKIPKTASVENHRTGVNVRYQMLSLLAGLFKAAGKAESTGRKITSMKLTIITLRMSIELMSCSFKKVRRDKVLSWVVR